jgi:hypothetical protein
MAVLQIAQFTLEIFICPYHISFVVAMYAVATSQGPLQIWTEHSPQSHFLKLQLRGRT